MTAQPAAVTMTVMARDPVVGWLLAGDISVQFRTTRDLLHQDGSHLQNRIADEGDGATILAARHPDGHWGDGFYSPKWTSTHYTLLELRDLGLAPTHPDCRESVSIVLRDHRNDDGGLHPNRSSPSDACVNGMALNYASYFGAGEDELGSMVDFLLGGLLPDGGFNCRSRREEVQHSSLHTTLSVVEGITSYHRAGHTYRTDELLAAQEASVEFLLRHRLFRSERTGRVIRPEFTRLHHPTRWYYDILRCLDWMADAGISADPRMDDALDVLTNRRGPDDRWPVNRSYPGVTHLPPPVAGTPNRWVTLRALRVLAAYT